MGGAPRGGLSSLNTVGSHHGAGGDGREHSGIKQVELQQGHPFGSAGSWGGSQGLRRVLQGRCGSCILNAPNSRQELVKTTLSYS